MLALRWKLGQKVVVTLTSTGEAQAMPCLAQHVARGLDVGHVLLSCGLEGACHAALRIGIVCSV